MFTGGTIWIFSPMAMWGQHDPMGDSKHRSNEVPFAIASSLVSLEHSTPKTVWSGGWKGALRELGVSKICL